MKLTELEPEFIRYDTRNEEVTLIEGDPLTWKPGDPTRKEVRPVEWTIPVATLAEAQGVQFACPKCHAGKWHLVSVSFAGRGVQDDQGSHGRNGKPSRWVVSGTGFHDLTLSPSIDLSSNEGSCGWHGWVRNGDAA